MSVKTVLDQYTKKSIDGHHIGNLLQVKLAGKDEIHG